MPTGPARIARGADGGSLSPRDARVRGGFILALRLARLASAGTSRLKRYPVAAPRELAEEIHLFVEAYDSATALRARILLWRVVPCGDRDFRLHLLFNLLLRPLSVSVRATDPVRSPGSPGQRGYHH